MARCVSAFLRFTHPQGSAQPVSLQARIPKIFAVLQRPRTQKQWTIGTGPMHTRDQARMLIGQGQPLARGGVQRGQRSADAHFEISETITMTQTDQTTKHEEYTRKVEVSPCEPALLNVKQVASLLGCSPRTVYRLADGGRIPRRVKIGWLVRRRRADIDQWIADGCPPCRRRPRQ